MLAHFSSPIGLLRIRADETQICSITFVEDGVVSSSPISHPLLTCCIKQLEEYFSGKRRHFDFPAVQTGTPFQTRVWQSLQNIPYGKTISYLALAKGLGDPKAIRAAGTANGKNSLAIVVPCHRVIGSNQQLIGYAGGLWRKQWLLEHEARHAYGVVSLF